MDDSSLRALFQKISSDDTLRRSLLEAPQPVPEGDNEEDESVAAGGDTTAVNRPQPDVEDGSEDTPLVADVHQMGRDASLVADARQSRGIGWQEADELLMSSSNPPGSQGDNSEDSNRHPPLFNPVLFDPSSVTSESEFTFDTHEIITEYLEKHFRTTHKAGAKPHP